MSKTESYIQKQILQFLRSLPWCRPFKIIAANERGVPDIICCLNGRFIAFEVKRPGAKPTQLQDVQHQRIVSAGGKVHIVTSLDEVKKIVASISL
jgi:hypothetical protein